jgi:hypothetical protein
MRLRTTALSTVLFTALLLGACGGGGGGGDGVASLGGDADDGDTTSTTLSEEEQEEAMLDWAACMREQGIDMPDPQVDANGRTSVIIGSSRETDDDAADGGSGPGPIDRAAFEAAHEECGEPPMLGGELSEEDRAEMQEQALEFAECMRDNGVEDFPDPDFSDMGPGRGPGTRVERFDDDDDAGGAREGSSEVVAGPFGVVELDDPEVRAAFEACQDDIGFGPGGQGGPPMAVAEASS